MARTAAAKKTTKSAPRKQTTAKAGGDRPYPEITVNGVVIPREAFRISLDRMKELVGWEEVVVTETANDDGNPVPAADLPGVLPPLFTGLDGTPVRFAKNRTNRPFGRTLADGYAQEILRGRWRLNGEPLIVTDAGDTVSLQHRAAALGLAVQRYRKAPEDYPYWHDRKEEPYLESLLVCGVSGDDETLNTIDTGRSRSEADVLYRSSYFADLPAKARKVHARAAGYAVKFLWDRTGAGKTGHALRRTPAEAMDFTAWHESLLRAVRHCVALDGEKGNLNKYLAPGTAAALLYLFATCKSDGNDYRNAPVRSEALLSMTQWDRAARYLQLLASPTRKQVTAKDDDKVKAVRLARRELPDQVGESEDYYFAKGETRGSLKERVCVLCLGWAAFRDHGSVTDDDVRLTYAGDAESGWVLINPPDAGGIDLGWYEDEVSDPPVTEAEVDAARSEVDDANGRTDQGEDDTTPPVNTETTYEEGVAPLRAKYPDAVLLFKDDKDNYVARGECVERVCTATGLKRCKVKGDAAVKFPATSLEEVVKRLSAAGHRAVMYAGRGEPPTVYKPSPPQGAAGFVSWAARQRLAATAEPAGPSKSNRSGVEIGADEEE